MQYTLKVINESLNQHEVFIDLIDNIMRNIERKEREKHKTNFCYNAKYDEFIQTITLVSSCVHKLIEKYLFVKTNKSVQ